MIVSIQNEDFELLPERAVLRMRDKTLLVADLHWGKAETFQQNGFAIPSTVLDDDLKRLTSVIKKTRAERMVILGDLIHSPAGVTDTLTQRIAAWRLTTGDLPIDLVRGNHDRIASLPTAWRIQVHDRPMLNAPFLYAHDFPEPTSSDRKLAEESFTWLGHEHPVIRLRGAGDSLRLPCFAVRKTTAVLPAFSQFTGGHNVDRPRVGERLFAIAVSANAEGAVLEI